MSEIAPLGIADLPKPPPLKKLIGPSFILLGLGLGSGELILWPYLASNYGFGIIWGAVLGITLQFFINMEIERYTLVTGESIFVGLSRKFKKIAPMWFLISTFLPWIWPGIIASSASLLAAALGVPYTKYFGIVLLLIIGLILTLGSSIYKTQEKFQKGIIYIGIPFIFLLTIFLTKTEHVTELAFGIIGKGRGYWFLPAGISISSFLAALAYAGAGGNLNLSQSYYIKEKGYGMGINARKLKSIISKNKENLVLEGKTFPLTMSNLTSYKLWWKRINIEHAIVFWATGVITMLTLSLLSYSLVYGKENILGGLNFIIEEASFIGTRTIPFLKVTFLIIAALMLFGTQFSVFGSTSRIMAENLVIYSQHKFRVKNLSKYFYLFLWLQILAGILIFMLGFSEPLSLIIVGAVMNAITMFIYSAMILYLNTNFLKKPLQPGFVRITALIITIVFYGGFSAYVIFQNIPKLLGFL
ncbi:hypothetical protein A3A76_02795 [Candidatus Woesebacteria bacterium RIFCSPLOWO2_01_FULL_39_23]|uniref:Amino acid permease/ SLC12A domain-containing protein n=1 Tax=Candidatus Woesebacteria bacterium RIFCSPHIGHO2_01_FULL_40_22 TaxID=1802499 RepID=A0A1F7YJD6_9BACT|nr:MAG: hypothetical protein A2141_01225 [Candidatus Woesebacteria bacterium RBG_16_40_11]OGM27403.1 MAG: hypothetical protein A2628_01200 [Candidatus Woesebacteria bacterium RIFCSPHIGHO2_01_FULL_40_22]OGM62575.1 MAG: hypothetical protein A3A76_02795 [Candidatus Woesebacteria bacterium RIFCSPLOWO2_01_FULL_39_23]